jgi:hypothetical protein
MPAHRRNAHIERKPVNFKKLRYLFIFFCLLLLGVILVKLFFFRRLFSSAEKLVYVLQTREGSVLVTAIDPINKSVTIIEIPKETEVEAAKGLGTMRIKNIWELGKYNGGSGNLLAKTVSKYFMFPVEAWGDDSLLNLTSQNPVSVTKSIFKPSKTNIGLSDRIAIGLFSLSVKNVDRKYIRLEQTEILSKKTLSDGSTGYVLSGFDDPKVYSIFGYISAKNSLKALIKSSDASFYSAKEVGKSLEIVGIKVASIVKIGDGDFTCKVSSLNKTIETKIADIFGCELAREMDNKNFDVEIVLGNNFSKIY